MIHSDGETHFEVSSGYIQVFQGESKIQKELCVVDINIYNMLTTQALLGNYSFTGRFSYIYINKLNIELTMLKHNM